MRKRSSLSRKTILAPSPIHTIARKGSGDTNSTLDPINDRIDLLDEPGSLVPQPGSRRASLLTNELLDPEELAEQDSDEDKVPVVLTWRGKAQQVYITGSFTGWRRKIPLTKQDDQDFFSATVQLAQGTHRLMFNVDGEWRTDDDGLPTATDSSGNFVNYIEVVQEDLSLTREAPAAVEDPAESETTRKWTTTIPACMTASDELTRTPTVQPPALPPHLEKVILNTSNEKKDDHSVLPQPNHVMLNHLAASSIRTGVLAVSATTRYRRKYVTTILYRSS